MSLFLHFGKKEIVPKFKCILKVIKTLKIICIDSFL